MKAFFVGPRQLVMKKLLAIIGVLFVGVVGLAIYNNSYKTVINQQLQPQPVVTKPTVSAPVASTVIVATGNVTPVYETKQ